MKTPRKNITISTVTVAASVVARLFRSEVTASEARKRRRKLNRSSLDVAAAAVVAHEAAALERDHAAAHLVDHLAVVRRHHDRRAGAVDAVEQLHDPDRGVGIEVARRLVADQKRRVVDDRARDRDALLLAA